MLIEEGSAIFHKWIVYPYVIVYDDRADPYRRQMTSDNRVRRIDRTRDMISSTSNPKIKNLIQLQKKAKERRATGTFVVEGRKMVAEAPIESLVQVYVSETFEGEEEHRNLLSRFSYEVLSDSVFKSVSDTQTPQGILAIVKQPSYQLSDLLQGDKTHLLVLESIQDPGNLGTMLRTGEGAGSTGIVMNGTTVDLFNSKTIRSTMGSIYRVPFFVTDDLTGTIHKIKEQGVHCYAAHLKGNASYDRMNYAEPTAFFIGNEGNGLSKEIADLADTYIRIPMEGEVESLNAAIAATILMYETNRQRRSN